jgi:hypothetical protein
MMPRKKLPTIAAPEISAPATIGFRLDETSLRVLCQRAARLNVSPHELARHYVEGVLQEAEERAVVRDAFAQLQENLNHFRRDFAVAVEALLTSAGTVSEEDARQWVSEGLHPN